LTKLGAGLVVGLLAGLAFGWWVRGQSDVDACLDAGGRWEGRGSYCVGAQFGPLE
jgi:hypothetical protein